MMRIVKFCCQLIMAAAALLPITGKAAAARLHVAAAADLALCMDALNAGFVRQYGNAEIRTSIGSSGNFYAQIINGAPFEVFLSADTYYPEQLAAAGFADRGSLAVYAHGRIALWSTDPRIDVNAGLNLLDHPDIRRIAIANPDVAPYGRAARAALMRAGIWDAVRHKLVFGDNVAQAAQFVESGNAQLGLVSSTLVLAPNGSRKGKAWLLPESAHPLLEQGAIVTASGLGNPAARQYLAFLQSDAGRAIIRQCGLALPPGRQ